jgi:hypothetical protein
MKSVKVIMSLVCLSAVCGCVGMSSSIPKAQLALKELETKATYDVIGPAKGTSTGGTVFFIFPVGMETKVGVVGNALMEWGGGAMYSPVQKAAVYNAIESVPGADALLAPRFDSTYKNYLIYQEETVTVKGKAVRINTSAEVPAAKGN